MKKYLFTLLFAALFVLPAAAQVAGLEFDNIALKEAEYDGVRGVYFSGKLDLTEREFEGSKVGKELLLRIREKGTDRMICDTSMRISMLWNDVNFTYDPARAGRDDMVTFIPVSQLGLAPGKHEIEGEIAVYDNFARDTILLAGYFPFEVEVPETQEFVMTLSGIRPVGGVDSTKTFLTPDLYMETDLHRMYAEEKDGLAGKMQLSPESQVKIGISRYSSGRGRGFRLFGIQITRGRSYTYKTDLDEKLVDIAPLFESGILKTTVRLDAKRNDVPPLEADLLVFSEEAFAESHPVIEKRPEVRFSVEETSMDQVKPREGPFQVMEWPFQCPKDIPEGFQMYFQITFTGDFEGNYRTAIYELRCDRLVRKDGSKDIFLDEEILEEAGLSSFFADRDLRDIRLEGEGDGAKVSVGLAYKTLDKILSGRDTAGVNITGTFKALLGSGNELTEMASAEVRLPWKTYIEYREAAERKKFIQSALIIGGVALVLIIGLYFLVKYLKQPRGVTDMRIEE